MRPGKQVGFEHVASMMNLIRLRRTTTLSKIGGWSALGPDLADRALFPLIASCRRMHTACSWRNYHNANRQPFYRVLHRSHNICFHIYLRCFYPPRDFSGRETKRSAPGTF